jgi:hypothetical protein
MRQYTLKIHTALNDTYWVVDGSDEPLYVSSEGDQVRGEEERDKGVLVQVRPEKLLKEIFGSKKTLLDAEGNPVAELKVPITGRKPSLVIDGSRYRGKVALGIAATSCTFKGPRRKVAFRVRPKRGLTKSTITVEVAEGFPLPIALLVAVDVYETYYTG